MVNNIPSSEMALCADDVLVSFAYVRFVHCAPELNSMVLHNFEQYNAAPCKFSAGANDIYLWACRRGVLRMRAKRAATICYMPVRLVVICMQKSDAWISTHDIQ